MGVEDRKRLRNEAYKKKTRVKAGVEMSKYATNKKRAINKNVSGKMIVFYCW